MDGFRVAFPFQTGPSLLSRSERGFMAGAVYEALAEALVAGKLRNKLTPQGKYLSRIFFFLKHSFKQAKEASKERKLTHLRRNECLLTDHLSTIPILSPARAKHGLTAHTKPVLTPPLLGAAWESVRSQASRAGPASSAHSGRQGRAASGSRAGTWMPVHG